MTKIIYETHANGHWKELFKNKNNHKRLNVHILHGRLKGRYSFSVNYRFRIVFTHLSKNEVVLLAVGDHTVYK